MNLTPDVLREICDGIVDAHTIPRSERVALVEEIQQHGLTPAILDRLSALFAAEEAAAQAGIDVLDRHVAQLNDQLSAEEARIAPELQQNSEAFAQSANSLASEAAREFSATEANFDAELRGHVASSDEAAAQAIRDALNPKQEG